MDNRPIGVYDTGLGGLSAVKELQKLMPKENIFYFGDTARVPYGGRSPESIKQFAKECLSFLEKQNVKLIVVACGTVSSVLGDNIEAGRKVPCMGVLKPTAHSAVAASKNQKIGVIATAATVASGAYERKIKEESERALVYSVSCPLFVPLVECGRTKLGDEVTTAVAKDYFKAFEGTDIDTLILGCTHYPFIAPIIDEATGKKLHLVDSGKETAIMAKSYLSENQMLTDAKAGGEITCFVTDGVESFREIGSRFLGRDLGNVNKVDLSQLAL